MQFKKAINGKFNIIKHKNKNVRIRSNNGGNEWK